jgi:polygalacturonase
MDQRLKIKVMRMWLLWLLALSQTAAAKDYLITDYGARTGPAVLNTQAINSAIQACHAGGGGRVVIPAGLFRSGTLLMKDNVELHLETGAILLADTSLNELPLQPRPAYRSQKDPGGWRALIYANEAVNIAVTGRGTIDGNGATQQPVRSGGGDLDGRPRNILFISCKQVRVAGIRMLNAGIWNQHYLNCEDVVVDGIQVFNHANRNNDGIDIDGCRRFLLANSTFDTDDDAIVLKSTGPAATEDVVITNCIVSSFCNAIKAGTESTGGFRNITVSNCVIKPSRDTHPPIYGNRNGIAGLSLEIVDGGVMEGVSISNITIEGSECPLYIRLGNRARKHIKEAAAPPMGKMRDIVISNVVAYRTGNYCSSITAVPGYYVENISLSNIQFHNRGGLQQGGYIDRAAQVKEDERGYPQPTVWKELPASGLFIRHARNVQVNGLMLGSERTDPRVPVMAVDVDGLQIKGIAKINNNSADHFFSGSDVRNIAIDTPLEWKKQLISSDE